MAKILYTIGEVAGLLGENISLVRFWSDNFSKFIHPKRNAKGNRLFSPEDVETFKTIHYLVKDCGLTLEGAAKKLAGDRSEDTRKIKVLESLRSIREQLKEISSSL
ncbi:MAG: MerR family transcriptional regulator [Bacteroidales bacterium]|nr:MerR family transcriptional regulator [Bacteroidales bacterium]